ncbi:uroporphyrin-III C-methyltransferase / precorrin-2 dehydrogenase / sirohydrochlorin ferrochelatase [Fontimonas thermophila]|uniref:Siroheme synthase n=1 Tax=Fontimonas thermophila TaxID=1076937 RepID=A0A1I2IDU5_9GAMM|nr:siroheme synthase CysG [Fontimonas thermophila]SFF40519.1 uroporphyrin-III C-methyltransferase / precorrin-2 dehydrogenase / sirohydrochlorin ferrochelatase [Fontimonas thermophila]
MSPTPWPYYPVFMRLRGERVLLVGGGEVAVRKLRLLLRAGARPALVAAQLHDEVRQLCAEGAVHHIGEHFTPLQLAGARLVIAATSDAELNQRVAAAAQQAGVPVNVVDDAALSSFVTPSVVDRAPLLVAISTGGAAPVLARRLRERIEAWLPTGYGRLAAFMHRWRETVYTRLDGAARRALWERFLDSRAVERVLSGDEATAERDLQQMIEGRHPGGEVYLVGAGPGDPDLLTFKALRLMQQCDVVLYDRLISPQVLDLVRRDAQRIFVGKARSRHSLPQEEINAELVRLAKAGLRVLRLKGGDPFIFGRGGEEIDTLMAHGIPFQVVPGITAASGCAAYAGIPLTHRDYAQTCIFITGHARKDGQLNLPWDQLARRGQTVVVYMGLSTLPQIAARLIEHGLPSDWPAAMIEQGTSPEQRVVVGTLGTLPQAVAATGFSAASLLIVGEVVRLRERLAWYGGAGGESIARAVSPS